MNSEQLFYLTCVCFPAKHMGIVVRKPPSNARPACTSPQSDMLMVFVKEFFENVNEKFPSVQRIKKATWVKVQNFQNPELSKLRY